MKRLLSLLLGLACLDSLPALAGTVVQFRTRLGDVDVECYDTEKPITTANFLRYVVDGAYANSFFHRAVPNFVIQGGGFRVVNRGTPTESLAYVPARATITNEFKVGPFLSNTAGTVAMAKTSDPNSATSQFFFNTRTNTTLDSTSNSGGFTVFARVIRGADVLERWNSFSAFSTTTNLIVNAGGALAELPVYRLTTPSVGSSYIDFADLVFVDISLLNVRIARTPNGASEIRWNPVAGRTNTVEYTDTFPPVWKTLTNVPPALLPNPVFSTAGLPTNGTVLNLPSVVTDPSSPDNRFYRVRATY